MFKSLGYPILAALMFAGCTTPPALEPAPKPPAPSSDARIKLAESMCYFKCASYEIEVAPSGHYKLNNIRDTKKDGVTEGEFGPDVWAKAQGAFDAAHFPAMPAAFTQQTQPGPDRYPCINDLPSAQFTRRLSATEEKTVTFNTGCNAPEASKLLAALREQFQWAALVKPGGQ
jgi:Domain of unknown function (DUF6438)